MTSDAAPLDMGTSPLVCTICLKNYITSKLKACYIQAFRVLIGVHKNGKSLTNPWLWASGNEWLRLNWFLVSNIIMLKPLLGHGYW